jgi:lysophospholipase L1-like esterase
MRSLTLIFVLILSSIFVSCKHETRIACIGDSITEGAGTTFESKSSYPVVLDSLLGKEYKVLNCGRGGATMLKKSDRSIWACKELYNVFAFQPEIVVIGLGTNDSKDFNWNAERYEKDYQAMIDTLNTMPTKPKIYICLPPAAFNHSWGINDSTITAGVIPILEKLQKQNNTGLINLNPQMRGKKEMFPDGIHPNEAGAALIARIIAKELKK